MVKSLDKTFWPNTLLPPLPLSTDAVAEHIRRTGARATPARIRVLQLLRVAPTALAHNEIEQSLGFPALDRVTLYRVLDWLVASGLAHKSTDSSRIYRFSTAAPGEHTTHIHFRCEQCGGVFCLDASPPIAPTLPTGFTLTSLNFDLRGYCSVCERTRR
jgi:Fur family transcriptional regulator, ferric uptake regulator